MLTVTVPQGEAVLVTLAETDGQFTISYGAPHLGVDTLLIHADMPDSTGREGIIYEEKYNLPNHGDDVAEWVFDEADNTHSRVEHVGPNMKILHSETSPRFAGKPWPEDTIVPVPMVAAGQLTPEAKRLLEQAIAGRSRAPLVLVAGDQTDYRAMAEELWDMLDEVRSILPRGDTERNVCELLDRHEATLKDK
jgi:hypothetical protein